MTDLIAAIGKKSDSVEIATVLSSLAPIRVQEDTPFRRYVGSPEKGIDLLFENELVISVQIFAQPSRTFSACIDKLPFGIQKSMNQGDVHILLGPPVESSNLSSKYMLPERGIKIVVTYDREKNIWLVSIGMLR